MEYYVDASMPLLSKICLFNNVLSTTCVKTLKHVMLTKTGKNHGRKKRKTKIAH